MKLREMRLLIYMVAAFMACSYVVLYNDHQAMDNRAVGRHLVGVAELLMKYQWLAFLVPFGAGFVALLPHFRDRRMLRLVPDLLAIFSIGWILVALFVWELQQPPVVAYPGFE